MSLPVLIVGGGGHAKVLIDILRLCSTKILGILDADPKKIGARILGVSVIGGDEAFAAYRPEDILLVNALGSVGLPEARKTLFERLKKKGFRFATVIHPSAILASDAVLGEGAQIMAGAVVQAGTRLGANTIVNTRASVDHDCNIGDHVHIAPGATLSGDVHIDNCTHIGTGATIIQGIAIGKNCVVGAGAVVLHNVADKSQVMGIPAKAVRK